MSGATFYGQENEFDYIVVGAGSAGCVVANRLSTHANLRVALVEAGPSDRGPLLRQLTRVPLGMLALMKSTRTNWGDTLSDTAPALRSVPSPRGRIAGGTSAINGMVYMRGHPDDYDAWVRMGNPGWNHTDVLQAFIRHEDFEEGPGPAHGQGGELRVERLKDLNPLSRAFLAAASEAGYPGNHDFNSGQVEGFGVHHLTMTNGERLTSARAFLHPIRHRANLVTFFNTLVERLTLSGSQVTGVEICQGEQKRTLRARREVILCGGAFNSPQLLMLSGIGEPSELLSLGLRVQHALPGVGKNYQDHACAPLIVRERGHASPALTSTGWATMAAMPWRYWRHRRGLMAESVIQCGGFINLPGNKTGSPDLKFEFMPVLRPFGSMIPREHGFIIFVTLLHPSSRGRLRLRSRSPADRPQIEPAFFSDATDLASVVEGLRIARQIIDQPAMAGMCESELLPGVGVQSDTELAQHVLTRFGTTFHPVGTCKMGPASDPLAVVDARLRVHGLGGLRVADVSIMPRIVCANTNAPAMMIGERAAHFVLEGAP
ncbi:hypothetical protein WL74_29400 [Burkholderia cepacia]|uniref:GMC family oxidoreductase n=1 Tax=Burkholderia cepacia TaxID=292 RepID=UPI00075F8860|nr:GMC family oxidoreductase N-terminal domain-containing protein [Burkholderia cepacia]KWE18351.1 hypothetical protein WL74_29400 [Burkholderia cepacia]